MTDENPRFVVGELSKNWFGKNEAMATGLLSHQFEDMLNVYFTRGYRLVTFSLHRLMITHSDLNETLIAVFERID